MTQIILPIIVPFITGIITLALYRQKKLQTILGVAGTIVHLAVAVWLLVTVNNEGILVQRTGEWAAPFGIAFVADLFSAIMVVVGALMGFTVALYSVDSLDEERRHNFFFPLYHILLMGVSGAFLTGDIFNMYVWFEIMLMSSFILMTLGGERDQMEGAIKYVTLNLLSSFLFLTGAAMIYSQLGTLNMADIGYKLSSAPAPALIGPAAMLLLTAYAIKSAMFPFFFWLPASYHTPPFAVSAIFAGLLTKVGVYALMRAYTIMFVYDVEFSHTVILWLAGFTMVTGVLGAAAQYEIRKILSFHIVSQIGYMVMGLGLYTPLAVGGAIFYLVHHIIVKTNLFLIAGVVDKIKKTNELLETGSLYKYFPLLSALFLIPALSLGGIPPLSGFWAKYMVIKASFDVENYWMAGTGLFVGLLTLFSMTKIWGEAFWKKDPKYAGDGHAHSHGGNHAAGDEDYDDGHHIYGDEDYTDQPASEKVMLFAKYPYMMSSISLLAALTVIIGLYGQPLFDLSMKASETLMNPHIYIEAVGVQHQDEVMNAEPAGHGHHGDGHGMMMEVPEGAVPAGHGGAEQ